MKESAALYTSTGGRDKWDLINILVVSFINQKLITDKG